jgi:DNA polymerase IIIc chi subunit
VDVENAKKERQAARERWETIKHGHSLDPQRVGQKPKMTGYDLQKEALAN